MKLSATQTFRAPREKVFAALTDPAVLKRCIEGCESMVQTSPDVYEVRLRIGVAGIKGNYAGRVEVKERMPPESLTLVLEGRGAPGFVKGTAAVRLAEHDGGTLLTSESESVVGGPIAAVASRLLDGVARKMMADFFRRLADGLTRET